MEGQSTIDTDDGLILRSCQMLQESGKQRTDDPFLKNDRESSEHEDLGGARHMGRNFPEDEMFRRLHGPTPVTTMGNDALDLSLSRHAEDSVDDDDFDEEEDECETGRGASPYLQALQDIRSMHRVKSPATEMTEIPRVSPNDNLIQLRPNLAQSDFLEEPRNVWSGDGETPCSVDSGLPANWHLPLNGPSAGLVGSGQELDLLSASSSLADEWQQESKDLAGVLLDGRSTNPWAVLHDSQHPLLHWGSNGGSPVVDMSHQSSSAHDVLNSRSLQTLHDSNNWTGSSGEKAELESSWAGLGEEKQNLEEHPDALADSEDWEKQTRSEHQVANWHKNLGAANSEIYSSEGQGHRNMYLDLDQKAQSHSNGFTVMTANQTEQKFHYRVAINNDNSRIIGLPRPESSMQHPGQCASSYYSRPPPHHANKYPIQPRLQVRGAWPNTGEHAKPQAWEHVVTSQRPNLEVNRAQLRQARPHLVSTSQPPDASSRSKASSSSLLKRSHPYKIKEQKAIVRDVQTSAATNIQTLKASHIVSWYIDYLIHENEDVTQISRTISLPVNLFHSDDFYFMDTLKKKVQFPSLKFLSWMQQNFPSINVNAVDFYEGRQPSENQGGTVWTQDRVWESKSRRDIIHDVFYFFQRQQQQMMMLRS